MARAHDPDRPPLGLRVFTWAYFAWWFLPIAIVVRASFTSGDSPTQLEGFSWGWYEAALHDEEFRTSLVQSVRLAASTTAIALPLGVATAVGLHRWRSRTADAGGLLVLIALAVPQTVLAAGLFLFLIQTPLLFGTTTQLLGHVTLAVPFVVVVVWVALASVPRVHEESAMDLGATQAAALMRVIFPQVLPALVAAAAVAWLLSFDNIVVSSWLCIRSDCATLPMRIYGRGGARAHPILYAYGSIGLAFTLGVAALATPWLIRAVRHGTSVPRRSVVG